VWLFDASNLGLLPWTVGDHALQVGRGKFRGHERSATQGSLEATNLGLLGHNFDEVSCAETLYDAQVSYDV
jgi:hypothetical protein